jgi:glycosyltransferase involved in cell wall biosynthesis
VSIVVTTKNAAQHLPDLLDDLRRLTWPHDRLQLVLVDAHSTDGTWETIQAFAAQAPFPVLALQKPGFIGAGRNEGFRHARGEFVAVTDADMRVPPSWIEELMAGMDAGVAVVGGPNETFHQDLNSRCQAAIPTHGPSVGAVPLLGANRWRNDYTTHQDVYGAVTRNSLFRKAAFDAVGGFDESLKVTEDPELMFRLLQAGWRIRYRRLAAVQHVHRDGLLAYYRQQRNYAYWQAHVNRKHPAMASMKQRAPGLALGVFLLTLPLGLLDPRLWAAPALLAIAALLSALAYALKAAITRRDPALVVALPVYFLAWQWAWATGFPSGALRAKQHRPT